MASPYFWANRPSKIFWLLRTIPYQPSTSLFPSVFLVFSFFEDSTFRIPLAIREAFFWGVHANSLLQLAFFSTFKLNLLRHHSKKTGKLLAVVYWTDTSIAWTWQRAVWAVSSSKKIEKRHCEVIDYGFCSSEEAFARLLSPVRPIRLEGLF